MSEMIPSNPPAPPVSRDGWVLIRGGLYKAPSSIQAIGPKLLRRYANKSPHASSGVTRLPTRIPAKSLLSQYQTAPDPQEIQVLEEKIQGNVRALPLLYKITAGVGLLTSGSMVGAVNSSHMLPKVGLGVASTGLFLLSSILVGGIVTTLGDLKRGRERLRILSPAPRSNLLAGQYKPL